MNSAQLARAYPVKKQFIQALRAQLRGPVPAVRGAWKTGAYMRNLVVHANQHPNLQRALKQLLKSMSPKPPESSSPNPRSPPRSPDIAAVLKGAGPELLRSERLALRLLPAADSGRADILDMFTILLIPPAQYAHMQLSDLRDAATHHQQNQSPAALLKVARRLSGGATVAPRIMRALAASTRRAEGDLMALDNDVRQSRKKLRKILAAETLTTGQTAAVAECLRKYEAFSADAPETVGGGATWHPSDIKRKSRRLGVKGVLITAAAGLGLWKGVEKFIKKIVQPRRLETDKKAMLTFLKDNFNASKQIEKFKNAVKDLTLDSKKQQKLDIQKFFENYKVDTSKLNAGKASIFDVFPRIKAAMSELMANNLLEEKIEFDPKIVQLAFANTKNAEKTRTALNVMIRRNMVPPEVRTLIRKIKWIARAPVSAKNKIMTAAKNPPLPLSDQKTPDVTVIFDNASSTVKQWLREKPTEFPVEPETEHEFEEMEVIKQ